MKLVILLCFSNILFCKHNHNMDDLDHNRSKMSNNKSNRSNNRSNRSILAYTALGISVVGISTYLIFRSSSKQQNKDSTQISYDSATYSALTNSYTLPMKILNDDSTKKTSGAGSIAYMIDPQTQEKYIILGYEQRYNKNTGKYYNIYTDMGGVRDSISTTKQEHILIAAVREYLEESCLSLTGLSFKPSEAPKIVSIITDLLNTIIEKVSKDHNYIVSPDNIRKGLAKTCHQYTDADIAQLLHFTCDLYNRLILIPKTHPDQKYHTLLIQVPYNAALLNDKNTILSQSPVRKAVSKYCYHEIVHLKAFPVSEIIKDIQALQKRHSNNHENGKLYRFAIPTVLNSTHPGSYKLMPIQQYDLNKIIDMLNKL